MVEVSGAEALLYGWWTKPGVVGKPSETFLKCQEEVQAISCATLFSPVIRQEPVQAMSE